MSRVVHLQANTSAWSSPPIDVDYRALPEVRQDQSQPGPASSGRNRDKKEWQDQSDMFSSGARDRQQQELYRTGSSKGSSRQRLDFAQRPASSRLRTKVHIRPAGNGGGRIVRQAQPGQVGVNLNTDAVEDTRSNLVRALLVVFPFLRDWGGFL